ncbi:hypothetical protein SAMN05421780_11061 [Flexibacter flexilis DSM 6793]|uniref:Uncharacterized protein n=1 Tax=Flexibacter flexilis DSM 6793 TaxID=927664 RepID=A0A1I1M7Q5_9BACT|nr:hypothetical protein [Flexibacter flexilis]SFC81245.1 hypothetical protein SAMN05421780_11061 [Flexibacter flexilis DSM 6793]
MAIKTEKLQEGWVVFTRFYCKEGFWDRVIGDQANNPNNPHKSNISLNSFESYWRCNTGKWIEQSCLSPRNSILPMINEFGEEFTAEEILDELQRINPIISYEYEDEN